ncbi:single-stranded-DNA-specific exonuclease [Lachnospiraceae bacterium XBB1006]|nr:single-stranded-DNA-specific exonuclease [Lachnospiraceae bacterium XBB1006]
MRKKQWMVQQKAADFQNLSKKLGIDPVTVRLLRNRNMQTEEEMRQYLYGGKEALYDGATMAGMQEGVALLLAKIGEHKPIRIIGDYDIDGITATYILEQGLKAMGAVVSHKIPHRIVDGYGLNISLIEQAYADGMDTIVTCDNGIAAMDAIKRGKELGMSIVVTDHHNVPYETNEDGKVCYLRSEADVIINPKQEHCPYPFPEICGAVVAFKLVEQLFAAAGMPEKEKDALWHHLLMFAAIGTVGDIMELREENRAIVKLGLAELRKTEDVSLVSLMEACGIQQQRVSAYHIGFVLGPCFNASGRLQTAEIALSLLLTKESEACKKLAHSLVELNEERKKMTEEQTRVAIELVQNSSLFSDRVLVVYLPDCHESIAGIIAGRVREQFYRPTLLVTKTEQGLKGSGRSIESYNMYEELHKVADCFTKFGGHAMAAGFSLEEEKLEELRRRLNDNAMLTEDDLTEKIHIDVPMPMDYVTIPFIQEMSLLEPFGKGNESPLFAQKNVEIVHMGIVGRDRKFVKLKLRTETGNMFQGIYFESPENFATFLCEKFGEPLAGQIQTGASTGAKIAICYVPDINTYQGYTSIQIRIKYVS